MNESVLCEQDCNSKEQALRQPSGIKEGEDEKQEEEKENELKN